MPENTTLIFPNNITVIRQSQEPIEFSHYMPATEGPYGQLIPGSEIVLNDPSQKEIEGFSLTSLFEFDATISDETKENFLKMAQQYEAEKGELPKFIIIPFDDPTKLFSSQIFFESDFIQWVKDKMVDNSMFLIKALPGSNNWLRDKLVQQTRTFGPKHDNNKIWAQVGKHDSEDLRVLADLYKQLVIDSFNSESSVVDMAERVRVHEMMHYVHTEALWMGAYKDITIGYCASLIHGLEERISKRFHELSNERADFSLMDWESSRKEAEESCISDERLRALLFKIRKDHEDLKGLAEAFAILHELYKSTIVGDGRNKAHEGIFSARLAILLSHLKRYPNSNKSTFEKELDILSEKTQSKSMEEHDLGTLVLLTKGDILSSDPSSIYDLNSDAGSVNAEHVIDLIESYRKNPSDFFTDFDPAKIKQQIEHKMRDSLLLILNSLQDLSNYVYPQEEEAKQSISTIAPLDKDHLDRIKAKLAA